MIVRLMQAAVAAAGLVAASAAAAQELPVPNDPTSFHGVSTFQTSDLIDGPGVQLLSGVVVAYGDGAGSYAMLLFALDYYQDPEGGERRVSATQNCGGETIGAELVITCEVEASSGTNYAPDNFRLTLAGERHWTGTVTSSGDKPVDFVDLD